MVRDSPLEGTDIILAQEMRAVHGAQLWVHYCGLDPDIGVIKSDKS